ncbi:MAG TPA: cyclic nucleotide-binding domain-containing protein [Candidatus Binatia bacterium]|nr:cyclic nucleotide-binding domain-containing protein [Candidatus Binatia bacterium]
MDVESALASTKLLSSLDRKTIKRLADQGKHRSYAAGETIIRAGAPASALYIILSGKVHFEVAEGGPAPVATAGPGDFFGELALIEEHPRSATVIADEPTECILFVAWEFTALLKEFPEMAVPLMNALIARLHRREHHQL